MNSNAIAGPSSMPSLIPHYSSSPSPPPPSHNQPLSYPRPPTPPLLYLPPPAHPMPKQYLASTQDLLGRFNLHPAYDRYVRPFITSADDHTSASTGDANAVGPTGAGDAGTGGGLDKGKGKEREGAAVATPAASGPGHDLDAADGGDGDDEDAVGGKGEKKKKNTYKHLIKGIPGKHSLKKDDYLTNIMLVPPKQRMRISRFDQRTQEDAFAVSSEGLKGWNINALVLESAQAREDRKKRKEQKRLMKLQGQNGLSPINTDATALSGLGTGTTPLPSAGGAGGGTPSASTPGAATVVAHPQPVQASGMVGKKTSAAPPRTGTGTPRVGTPRGVGTPRPASAASSVHPLPPPPPPAIVAGAATPSNTGVRSSNPSPVVSTGPSFAGGGAPSVAGANATAVSASGGHGGTTGGPPMMIARPKSTVPRPGSTVPRPGSTVPRPGSGVVKNQQQQQQGGSQVPMRTGTPVNKVATPMRVGTPMDVDQLQHRGKKREREEGGPVVNGIPHGNNGVNGMVNGVASGGQHQQQGVHQPSTRPLIVNAKAGTGNIRPRPIKKQRMDVQGQARDVTAPVQQQPTPQGV